MNRKKNKIQITRYKKNNAVIIVYNFDQTKHQIRFTD